MIPPRGTSRLLVVLGDPVAHSLSPLMQNAAIAVLGYDAVYAALRVPADRFPDTLRVLAALGVAGNVTVPHKVAAAATVDDLTDTARQAGAVNTFWCDQDGVHGDNTDVAGVLEAVDQVEGEGPWLVLGTGGAARAVAVAASRRGVRLLVRSRAVERAEGFREWAAGVGVEAAVWTDNTARTVINATPLGLRADDPLPLPPDRLADIPSVVDLVYGPGGTPWVREARARGCRAVDGRTMLVGQGAAAFERFFPGSCAPRDVMRAAVDRALTA